MNFIPEGDVYRWLIETRVVFEYDFSRYELIFTSRLIETRVVFELEGNTETSTVITD